MAAITPATDHRAGCYNDRRREIIWSLLHKLEDLDYEHNIWLMSQKITGMHSELKYLKKLARGLEINIKEIKAIRINNTKTDNVMLQSQPTG